MKIRIYPKSLLETVWQQDKLLFTPEAEQPPLCLRCGQPLDRRLVINALSRYADVHICEACGIDEALRDANRCPLPLTEWAAVKNGLSQQQTDFEDPLLTTLACFDGVKANQISDTDVRQTKDTVGRTLEHVLRMKSQYPVVIGAEGVVDGEKITWKRELKAAGGRR